MNNSLKLQVDFLGEITASVAHDLQNTFAVIRETSGLIEDLISMTLTGEKHLEKDIYSSGISSIVEQVDRGVSTTSKLNSFAHTVGEVKTSNPVEIIKNLLCLIDRILKRKGLRVEFESDERIFSIPVPPVLFQLVLYRGILYLGQFIQGGVFRISINNKAIGSLLVAQVDKQDVSQRDIEDSWMRLCQLAEIAKSNIEALDEQEGFLIDLKWQ